MSSNVLMLGFFFSAPPKETKYIDKLTHFKKRANIKKRVNTRFTRFKTV